MNKKLRFTGLMIVVILFQFPLFAQKGEKMVAKRVSAEAFKLAMDACSDKKVGDKCSYELDGQTVEEQCVAQTNPNTNQEEVICRQK
jgi:hypothetical protein